MHWADRTHGLLEGCQFCGAAGCGWLGLMGFVGGRCSDRRGRVVGLIRGEWLTWGDRASGLSGWRLMVGPWVIGGFVHAGFEPGAWG